MGSTGGRALWRVVLQGGAAPLQAQHVRPASSGRPGNAAELLACTGSPMLSSLFYFISKQVSLLNVPLEQSQVGGSSGRLCSVVGFLKKAGVQTGIWLCRLTAATS